MDGGHGADSCEPKRPIYGLLNLEAGEGDGSTVMLDDEPEVSR